MAKTLWGIGRGFHESAMRVFGLRWEVRAFYTRVYAAWKGY